MKHSIRTRLLLIGALASLTPVVLVTAYHRWALLSAMSRQHDQQVTLAASRTGGEITRWTTHALDLVRGDAQLLVYQEVLGAAAPDAAAIEAARAQLRMEFRRDTVFVKSVGLVGTDGVIRVHTAADHEGLSVAQSDWFRGAVTGGLPQLAVFPAEGEIVVASAVRRPDGEVVGVLELTYRMLVLQWLVARETGVLGPDAHAIIVDDDGRELADGFDPERIGQVMAPWGDGDGVERVTTLPRGWEVVYRVPDAAFRALLDQEALRAGWVMVIVLGVAIVGARLSARALGGPLEALLAATRRVRDGDLDARLPPTGIREYDELGDAFVQMTRGLREARERLVAEQAELARMQAHLEHAARLEAVGRLAGGIAHDFNNLLTPMLSGLDLLMAGDLDADARGDVERMVGEAVDQARQVTQQLLGLSRRGPARPVVVDLGRHVQRSEALVRASLRTGVSLAWAIEEGATILVDPGQVQQVLLNLALNANDAMPLGGVLRISAGKAAPSAAALARLPALGPVAARLVVQDGGTGMSDDTLGRLFEPFFTTKPLGKGTGLGLASVWGILQQQGGTIEVASRVGEGATFTVWWPLIAGAEASVEAAPARGARDAATVLVVDDQELVAQAARRALEAAGHRVLVATDSLAALDMLRGFDGVVDVLVTDVVMPVLDGPALAREVRRWRPTIAIVFTSGYPGDRLDGVMDELHAGFVPKPWTPAQLTDRIASALGR